MTPKHSFFSIGIDPGLQGKISIIEVKENKIYLKHMSSLPFIDNKIGKNVIDDNKLRDILAPYIKKPCVLVIEEQFGHAGTHMKAVNTMMRNYGMLLGILTRLFTKIDMWEIIPPTIWQQVYYAGEQYKGLGPKERSLLQIKELFGITFMDHNITDSLLIALYGIVIRCGMLLPIVIHNYTQDKEVRI